MTPVGYSPQVGYSPLKVGLSPVGLSPVGHSPVGHSLMSHLLVGHSPVSDEIRRHMGTGISGGLHNLINSQKQCAWAGIGDNQIIISPHISRRQYRCIHLTLLDVILVFS